MCNCRNSTLYLLPLFSLCTFQTSLKLFFAFFRNSRSFCLFRLALPSFFRQTVSFSIISLLFYFVKLFFLFFFSFAATTRLFYHLFSLLSILFLKNFKIFYFISLTIFSLFLNTSYKLLFFLYPHLL